MLPLTCTDWDEIADMIDAWNADELTIIDTTLADARGRKYIADVVAYAEGR